MKFKVNEDLCIGCGACASLCDDVFEIGDEGFAVAKNIKVDDPEIKENAIDAMEGCPTDAISEDEEKEA